MDNQALLKAVTSLASHIGCSRKEINITFFINDDDQPHWMVETPHRKDRPRFLGFGESPKDALADLLASNGYREWRDPERYEAERAHETAVEMLKELQREGKITRERLDEMLESANRKLQALRETS